VGSDDSVAAAVEQVIERFGRINVLVNNAGIGSSGADEENSLAQAQRLFNINVFGVMRMTKAVLPHMRAQGSGRIINTSSILGFLPAPYMANYSWSKHALEGYTESLDHEIREHGVRARPAWRYQILVRGEERSGHRSPGRPMTWVEGMMRDVDAAGADAVHPRA
jgi:short-subunit dehydrogenase